MSEAPETVGALAEVEVCADCQQRIVVVAPLGEGDEAPSRYHVGPICPAAYKRGEGVIAPDDADALLGTGPEEGPAPASR